MTDKAGSAGSEPAVLFELAAPHVALVTLNRPKAHNAVNGDIATLLDAAVQRAEADADIRVVILAARGPSFCAGADLKLANEGRAAEMSVGEAGFAGFVNAKRSKPWIAAVHAGAFGGGTEIALSCDLVIAGEKALFALPEVGHGIIAGAGGSYRIARALPRALAIEMLLTGAAISAERAAAFGLVNRVVAAGTEVAAATELALAIARNAPNAVRESLRIVRTAADGDEKVLAALQAEAIGRVLASPNAAEGIRAFVEKRAPAWVG